MLRQGAEPRVEEGGGLRVLCLIPWPVFLQTKPTLPIFGLIFDEKL